MQIKVMIETKLKFYYSPKPEAVIACDAEVKSCSGTQVVAEREVDLRYIHAVQCRVVKSPLDG